MATHNDVTGDALVSRVINSNYADNYDRIFRKPKPEEADESKNKQEKENEPNKVD